MLKIIRNTIKKQEEDLKNIKEKIKKTFILMLKKI
jgi:hypothetical protein